MEFELIAIREHGKSTITTLSRYSRARNVTLMPQYRSVNTHGFIITSNE